MGGTSAVRSEPRRVARPKLSEQLTEVSPDLLRQKRVVSGVVVNIRICR
jgi:hypothetical protein